MPYNFRVKAKNIAIHEDLFFQCTFNNTCIGIFAPNGTGKTAISRMIRLADKCCPIENSSKINKYITFKQQHGSFEFGLSPNSEPNKVLKISLNKNNDPKIENNTPYIFHVFNSDYVNDNLAVNRYIFDEKIDGYIIGKEKIDISSHEINRNRTEDRINKIKKQVEESIRIRLNQLDNIPIRSNTIEYKQINFNSLYNRIQKNETESFETLRGEYKKVNNMPDLNDVQPITAPGPAEEDLNKVVDFLFKIFSKGNITNEFKQKVRQKEKFIEDGLNHIDKSINRCPFCEQTLSEDALVLIDHYNEYLEDEETKIRKKAKEYFEVIRFIKKIVNNSINKCFVSSDEYNNVIKYIPSMKNNILPPIDDISKIEPQFKELEEALIKKADNISLSFDKKDAVFKINMFIKKLTERIGLFNKEIEIINIKKTQMNGEKLSLRRRLCNSVYMELYKSQEDRIKEIKELEKKFLDIKKQIDKLESSFKESKKGKVSETLKRNFEKFFGDKYIFDEHKFCLRLQDTLLAEEADDFLSDGEKSIIAFIYFLASTHRDIEIKSDYNKLFYVIDDPVSSMDFDYVYAIANTIRDLYLEQKVPILLLTHNLEFMSILIRNKVIGKKFFLSSNNLEELGDALIMPYEEHLRDIYLVSKRNKPPSHTTPNSIRHILETLWRFENPELDKLGEYLKEQKIDDKNVFLNALIQDFSHGIIRTQPAYTPKILIDACTEVISFIEKKHCGQIRHIDHNYQPMDRNIS